jgi:ribonucleotide reductase alpha subunit
MANKIIMEEGSVQNIPEIPNNLKAIYKTVYEIKQSTLMKRASLRQAFVDQSQSLNISVSDNSLSVLKGIFFTGWSLGLKTTSYYIHTGAGKTPMKNIITTQSDQAETCAIGCTSCSS